ncbi:Aldo/keto reductase [Neolentinus lepideus HHB14362 ss-1]|uniref:Aldo/keto reductase n=1 Tax=Neolentinus lepideus HHB14362 ss-1 TaxID=1314782 RepID=A0A165Q5M2_9AGAM|nr:Aldo/keto reductase [Neolentinus lepideus HHB14362 ss-1]
MSYFAPPPPSKTSLARYRQLAPSASVHVSPLCLGAMSIGTKWEARGMGAMNKESSIKLLDAFFDAGGNFIDTANNYQDESSEEILGEWMETRGIRDQIVIATKYTTGYKKGDDSVAIKVNYLGNHVKSMHVSVRDSLRKLRTDYIDVLYVHWWDWNTTIEEVMDGLHALVMQGKVLYLGVSDTPAWVVAKANTYARLTHKTPFVIYQGAWNVMDRDFERDIIPMCRSEGLGLAPWNVIAAGHFRTDEEEERRRQTGEKGRLIFQSNWERSPDEKKMSHALEKVAKEVGVKSLTAVAIAYVMHKTPYVFPIIGGRKVEQLQDNIEALDISLSDEQIKYLESILPFAPGFPTTYIGDGSDSAPWFKFSANIDRVEGAKPIRPAKI